MRSAFRSPGVPSTREAGTASLVGGPSNRPMRAGFAENSFLIIVAPSYTSARQLAAGAYGKSVDQLVISCKKPLTINVHLLNRIVSSDCVCGLGSVFNK